MKENNQEQKDIQNYFSVVISLKSNVVFECWTALGIILSHYPQAGKIEDYVNFPKFNQFRSLKTTVYDGKGKKFEYLIRTN
jgi:(p)ppGpp synthase/HD superfamily hydrolase